MQKQLIVILVLASLISERVFCQEKPQVLTPFETQVYNSTFEQCRSATLLSAVQAGFKPEVIASAASNISGLLMLSLPASAARAQSGMYSPELYKIRNNYGYWLALVDCYQNEPFFRKLLISGLIQMGHHTTEIIGTFIGLFMAAKLAAANLVFLDTYPIAYKTFIAAGISQRFATLFHTLKREYFSDPTPEQKQHIEKVEANLFKDTDKALVSTITLLQLKVKDIDERLQNPHLGTHEKESLTDTKGQLQTKIKILQRSISN